RCRGTFFAGILGMDSQTREREAEHQHTQNARDFHESFLHSEGFPPHSNHRIGSSTIISPSSSTSPNAPPALSLPRNQDHALTRSLSEDFWRSPPTQKWSMI